MLLIKNGNRKKVITNVSCKIKTTLYKSKLFVLFLVSIFIDYLVNVCSASEPFFDLTTAQINSLDAASPSLNFSDPPFYSHAITNESFQVYFGNVNNGYDIRTSNDSADHIMVLRKIGPNIKIATFGTGDIIIYQPRGNFSINRLNKGRVLIRSVNDDITIKLEGIGEIFFQDIRSNVTIDGFVDVVKYINSDIAHNQSKSIVKMPIKVKGINVNNSIPTSLFITDTYVPSLSLPHAYPLYFGNVKLSVNNTDNSNGVLLFKDMRMAVVFASMSQISQLGGFMTDGEDGIVISGDIPQIPGFTGGTVNAYLICDALNKIITASGIISQDATSWSIWISGCELDNFEDNIFCIGGTIDLFIQSGENIHENLEEVCSEIDHNKDILEYITPHVYNEHGCIPKKCIQSRGTMYYGIEFKRPVLSSTIMRGLYVERSLNKVKWFNNFKYKLEILDDHYNLNISKFGKSFLIKVSIDCCCDKDYYKYSYRINHNGKYTTDPFGIPSNGIIGSIYDKKDLYGKNAMITEDIILPKKSIESLKIVNDIYQFGDKFANDFYKLNIDIRKALYCNESSMSIYSQFNDKKRENFEKINPLMQYELVNNPEYLSLYGKLSASEINSILKLFSEQKNIFFLKNLIFDQKNEINAYDKLFKEKLSIQNIESSLNNKKYGNFIEIGDKKISITIDEQKFKDIGNKKYTLRFSKDVFLKNKIGVTSDSFVIKICDLLVDCDDKNIFDGIPYHFYDNEIKIGVDQEGFYRKFKLKVIDDTDDKKFGSYIIFYPKKHFSFD